MLVNVEGWIEGATQRISPRSSHLKVPSPLGIVWHYTGGAGGKGYAEKLAHRIEHYDRATDRPASWHLLIAKDGEVFQSVSALRGSWHVGRPGKIAGTNFENVNHSTVGVELENAGRLKRVNGGQWFCWPYWSDKEKGLPDPACEVHASRAVRVQGEGSFDCFPFTQEAAAIDVLSSLVERFGWTRDVCGYGHRDFDYPRKEDPGPLWARTVLPRILDAVFAGR